MKKIIFYIKETWVVLFCIGMLIHEMTRKPEYTTWYIFVICILLILAWYAVQRKISHDEYMKRKYERLAEQRADNDRRYNDIKKRRDNQNSESGRLKRLGEDN